MGGTVEIEDAAMQRQHVTGTLRVVVTLAVAIILGFHPFGSTDLYDDGARFVEHVGALWVVIHLAGAVLFLAITGGPRRLFSRVVGARHSTRAGRRIH